MTISEETSVIRLTVPRASTVGASAARRPGLVPGATADGSGVTAGAGVPRLSATYMVRKPRSP